VCKSLIAAHKDLLALGSQSDSDSVLLSSQGSSNVVTPALVARCARTALATVRAACGGGSGDPRLLALCAALIEREALPQAGRWHRRDLVAGATAAWRAVLRALRTALQAAGDIVGGMYKVAAGDWSAQGRSSSMP
jgi:hypothetical protein